MFLFGSIYVILLLIPATGGIHMKLIWLLPDDSTVVVMVSDIVQYLNILRAVNSVSLGFATYKIVSINSI